MKVQDRLFLILAVALLGGMPALAEGPTATACYDKSTGSGTWWT